MRIGFTIMICKNLMGVFLQFMTNKLTHFHSISSIIPFVILDNETERQEFIDYVVNNEEDFHKIKPDYWADHAKK